MKRSLAMMISATWRFSKASVLVNCTSNSPNMKERVLAAFKASSSLSKCSSLSSIFRKVAHPSLVVVLMAASLAACSSNREIQKDGSGTDEMLRSPCACLPVPYEAPTFKWGVG